jgi:hypothetical protein
LAVARYVVLGEHCFEVSYELAHTPVVRVAMCFAISDKPTVEFVILDYGSTFGWSQAQVNEAAYRVAIGSGIEFGEADALVGGTFE